MSKTRTMRKSILSIAMGLCVASLASAPALAQTATGGVAGRANAGDTITAVSYTHLDVYKRQHLHPLAVVAIKAA